MNEYTKRARAYARKVVAEKVPACRWVKAACQRQLDDLNRRDWEWTFDSARAADICGFIEQFPHVEGRWKTKRIALEDWQCFYLTTIFGWVSRVDGRRRFRKALVVVARRNAKALALETPVPTPSGWTTMGELNAGDQVFDENGAPCTVTHVSEIFIDHDCYEVTFSNGECVNADAGHLWKTTAHVNMIGVRAGRECPKRGGPSVRTKVRTTEELFRSQKYGSRGDSNHSLQIPFPLALPEVKTPIEPYLLGVWLGDGTSAAAHLSCGDADKDEMAGRIRSLGYEVSEARYKTAWRLQICATDRNIFGDRVKVSKGSTDNLQYRLRNLGVLGNKHIPSSYLRASFDQRLDLLQGLMDTDGTISKDGRVISYTTITERLADQVSELLSTLGIKNSISRGRMRCNGVPVPGISYRVQFMAFRDDLPVFKLSRKLARMRLRSQCERASPSRTVQVTSVRKIPSVPTRCIAVDSPTHMFLFGKTMLPTHNTTLAALIGLYLLCCDGEPGAQIYSAATTRDQAKISWRIAKRMAEREPEFRECFGVEPLAHSITVEQTGSFFQAISRDSKPAEGFSVHGAIIDELHAHKTREIFDVLDEATGSRRQPLVFIISTEGDNAAGIFAEQRAYAENILAGNHQDDSYFAAIYTLDKGDDWTDPAIWVKANPNIGVSLFEEDLRVRCKQAQKNPASQSSFLTKRCNVRVGAGEAYFNMLAWEHKCKDAGVQLEDFYGLPCQAYLDLASESDIAAKVLLFKRDEVSYVFGKWYLPEDSLERGNPNYDVYRGWADSERIVLTPGSAIDFEFIERDLLEDARNFQLQTPACDQFQATYLATRLKAQGIELFKYGATVKNFSEPMKHLNGLILAGKIKHDGDPALTWMMGNVTARRDAKDNVFPRKTRDENKIDGAVALIAALGVRLAAEPEQEPGAFAVSF